MVEQNVRQHIDTAPEADIFVTTERSPSDGVRRWAQALAARLHAPLADRRHESIERLARLNARLAPGDHLLDCTCGLGADAIVASCVVGPAGCVETIEASTLLAESSAQVSRATTKARTLSSRRCDE